MNYYASLEMFCYLIEIFLSNLDFVWIFVKLLYQDFKSFLAGKTDDSLSLFDSRVSRDGSDSSGSDAN